jgi:cysteine-rich repeat protein
MKKITIIIIFCILLLINITYAEEITEFSNGLNNIIFPFEEATSDSIQIEITEANMCVDTAMMSITGEFILSTEQGSADIVLITDRSGSMGWTFTDDWSENEAVFRECDDPNINLPTTTRISVAKCIDKKFVNDFLNPSNPSLKISLVSYSTTSNIDQLFTNNNQILIDEIDSYVDTYSTCISCAIDDAINVVQNNGTDGSPKSIILMTDGETNHCIGGSCSNNDAIDEVEDLSCNYDNSAANLGIIIYTVAFGDGSQVNEDLLQDIADCTGGQYFNSDDPETLFDIYEQIAQDIMTNSYPTPSIDINNDGSINFDVSNTLDGTIIWDDNSCTGALCDSLISELNISTTTCDSPPCSIELLVSTLTPGNITLDNLYINTYECSVPSYCGDNEIQSPNNNNEFEECDNGTLNNDFIIDACRTNCLNATCGDNFIDTNEECDNGTLNNDFIIDACRTNCLNAYCGDNYIDLGEECDNGTLNNDFIIDACRTNCLNAFCGDNFIDSNEECDDGPFGNNDCNPSCEFSFCGDGIIQNPNHYGIGGLLNDGNEICDNGTLNNDTTPNACRTNCTKPICGDNIIDNLLGEECDDGNLNNFDSCNNTCFTTSCNNNIVEVGEDCDDGTDTDFNDECIIDFSIAIPYVCRNATCGDNYTWTTNCIGDCEEQCDNGTALNSNTNPNACRENCSFPVCGDEIEDYLEPNNEICDVGPGDDTDGCDDSCQLTTDCGNNIEEGQEECDWGTDGNDNVSNHCRIDCQEPKCGDDITDDDPLWGEECDDGNLIDGDDCDHNCQNEDTSTRCGDGSVNQNGEVCDHGDDGSLDCTPDCKLTVCSDEIIQNPNSQNIEEECDDGNQDNTDLCSHECKKLPFEVNLTTIQGVDFISIDLFENYDKIKDYWINEVLFDLDINPTSTANIDILSGPNSIKFLLKDDTWTGEETILVKMINPADGNWIEIKFNLKVINAPNYISTPINQTRLLVAKGNLVTGYGLDPLFGRIETWGPYIITVKVWEKDKRKND